MSRLPVASSTVTHFFLGKNLTVVTEWGEVYSGQCSVGKPLVMSRLTGIQNAKAVFTDFKANNFAYIQSIFRYNVHIIIMGIAI